MPNEVFYDVVVVTVEPGTVINAEVTFLIIHFHSSVMVVEFQFN